MSQLLPYSAYASIFEPLRGCRLGYVRGHGNVGDRLIDMGLDQLLNHFDLSVYCFDHHAAKFTLPPGGLDFILCFGGGNFGDLYPRERQLRERALRLRVPVIVLPQSAKGLHEYGYPYQRVYFRERYSFRCFRFPQLAPDLALCVQMSDPGPAQHEIGIFLRSASESVAGLRHAADLGDPALKAKTPQEYLALAANYEHLVTNRLHFAIAGLLCGRKVTLLPNAYHKNRGMYEAWLADLGCHWAESFEDCLPGGC